MEFIDCPETILLWSLQAVRSVAFSQSGRVVAVGANSRTLRLCSTTALLEGRVRWVVHYNLDILQPIHLLKLEAWQV